MFKPSSVLIRSAAVALAAGALIAGCGGNNGFSSTGSSSNNVSTIQLSFPVKPSLTQPGVYLLNVRAYDRTGTLITVPYSYPMVLQSNNQCQVGFEFYSVNTTAGVFRHSAATPQAVTPQATPTAVPTATPTPTPVSISWNNPKTPVAVLYDPTAICGTTIPATTTITASSVGATSATINI